MNKLAVIFGALLLAAPAFSQGARSENDAPGFSQGARSQNEASAFSQGMPEITVLQLTETRAQVAKVLGPPAKVESGGDFESWQYQVGVEDNHDFSHFILFRASTGELISATHNFEPAKPLDTLFPAAETRVYHYPNAEHPEFSVRLRKLDGGRFLLAMGSEKQGSPVAQLLLIRESELAHFYSWIIDQMPSK
jgi:hypothetical protein